jgi:hypothetical protein
MTARSLRPHFHHATTVATLSDLSRAAGISCPLVPHFDSSSPKKRPIATDPFGAFFRLLEMLMRPPEDGVDFGVD